MKLNIDQVLSGLDGAPLTADGDQPLTLKVVVANALLQPQQEDPQVQGLAYRLYTLAQTIHAGEQVELEAADIDLIKKRLERVYPPIVVGQSWNMLEGK